MAPLGKTLILTGVVLVLVGTLIWTASSIPFVGRLPGDIYIKRGNFTFFFPLATCVLISAALSLLFMLLRR
jgi:DUF2905 family protein